MFGLTCLVFKVDEVVDIILDMRASLLVLLDPNRKRALGLVMTAVLSF